MSHIKYRLHIEQDEDGIFVAELPALPGNVSQGQTRKDALSNAHEAIALYHSKPKSGTAIDSRRSLRRKSSRLKFEPTSGCWKP